MIVKIFNKTEFAQIPNKTLRDSRLSLDSRGALVQLLSYSGEFETDVPSLMKLFRIGRKRLLKITNEWKEAGYLEIVSIRGRGGVIIDKEWRFFAESQEANFRPEIVRSRPFIDPNQESLFDEFEISDAEYETSDDDFTDSDQDACYAYVGVNGTSVEGHHHLKIKDGFKAKEENKELEIRESLSQKQTERESENIPEISAGNPKSPRKSVFTLTQISEYVQMLIANGANIINPVGYAVAISRSSQSDAFIEAALSKKTKDKPPNKSKTDCPRCYGTGLEYIFGEDGESLGVRSGCEHEPLKEGEYLWRWKQENAPP